MSKNYIDWSNAPEWANYWAVDDDGIAYWYENEPRLSLRFNMWRLSVGNLAVDNISNRNLIVNWQQSLVKRSKTRKLK